MQLKKYTEIEKKKIIKDILGENQSAVGKNFPAFSALIDYLGMTNDALSFAELIPSLNTIISGTVTSSIVSSASFIGILLFPVAQMINVINAYQTGHRMYSYRCIAYTMTAWAFDKPVPSGSNRVLSNLSSGPVRAAQTAKLEYNQLWTTTSRSVLNKLNATPIEKRVPKEHVKAIFRAFGGGTPEKLCSQILTGFEQQFDPNIRNIWRSNYSIKYPF